MDSQVPGKGKIMKYGLYTCRGVQQCDTAEYLLRGTIIVPSNQFTPWLLRRLALRGTFVFNKPSIYRSVFGRIKDNCSSE